MDTLSKRLKHYRENQNLSIRDVAAIVKVSPSTYRGWEFGAEIKGGEAYVILAKLYNVSLGHLLTGKTSSLEIQLEVIERAIKVLRAEL